ncbi:MTH895/ArsE family thioredoxin-like protein [Iamia sp. SCSIO 61187]|uniref:MTH895/ArsE family thioredoxin-like protein n=1 Tax=Iamia sp. SCSIO 61187 TaxID=2722752 RepID=UPI001C62FBEA|nr:MTH895/ArsE family thioredoxin-like protein [Iamia sp. SCSIO 61187]
MQHVDATPTVSGEPQGDRHDRSAAVRRWGPVAVAAVAWAVAYRVNAPLWHWVVGDAAGLDLSSRLGSSVHFFFYDVTKISLLLSGVIFVVTVLRTFMSVERTRALLGGQRRGAGHVGAAGLGVVTPFCSCSAVPIFIGFVTAGVPLGVTFSFLIAAPLVNEVAVVLLFGSFGWKAAALYVSSGLAIAVVAGAVLGRLRLERWVEPFVFETRLHGELVDASGDLSWDERLSIGREEVVSILRKVDILGRGCARCRTLEEHVVLALRDLDVDAEVGHVTDPVAIASAGVMRTPALAIDGEVVVAGRVPSDADLRAAIAGRRTPR